MKQTSNQQQQQKKINRILKIETFGINDLSVLEQNYTNI